MKNLHESLNYCELEQDQRFKRYNDKNDGRKEEGILEELVQF